MINWHDPLGLAASRRGFCPLVPRILLPLSLLLVVAVSAHSTMLYVPADQPSVQASDPAYSSPLSEQEIRVIEFTDIAVPLPGVDRSSVAWGDYDSDGDLDILLTGRTIGLEHIARVYRNDGGGSFIGIAVGLQGVSASSVAWGDYDNDGDLDILLTGWAGLEPATHVYRNDGRNRLQSL